MVSRGGLCSASKIVISCSVCYFLPLLPFFFFSYSLSLLSLSFSLVLSCRSFWKTSSLLRCYLVYITFSFPFALLSFFNINIFKILYDINLKSFWFFFFSFCVLYIKYFSLKTNKFYFYENNTKNCFWYFEFNKKLANKKLNLLVK